MQDCNKDTGLWQSETCDQCRGAKKKCLRESNGYRAKCSGCVSKNLDCSLLNNSIRFYATDFYFRHEPEGSEEWTEKQPRNDDRDEMQYFYVEWPYESSKPWSPLYVRQQMDLVNVSPFRFTPIIYNERETDFGATNVLNVQNFWQQHHVHPNSNRPGFAVNEKILTCRRICSLNVSRAAQHKIEKISQRIQGFLEVSAPKPDTFVPFRIKTGLYRVFWRLQFVSTEPTQLDRSTTFDQSQVLVEKEPVHADSVSRNARGHLNPLGYPIWEHGLPRFPDTPVLQLSVGYKKILQPVRDYFMQGIKTGYRRGLQLSDQILTAAGSADDNPSMAGYIRQDKDLESRHCLALRDKGWQYIEADGKFRVIQEQQPTFVVSNYDVGKWQGGFRFGGVELVRVED